MNDAMDGAIGFFPTHDAMSPGALARLVESRGFPALYMPEHSHIPAGRETPWPSGGTLPRKYAHNYDLFIALSAALFATSTLRVGSGICLVVHRDPLITANEVASLDHLSGGRFEFGVGAGWNREEMANHGTDPRTRMALLAERIEAMKEIWANDEATFHGSFVDFDRVTTWPKPVQRPHPPILLGGNGPTVFDRVLGFGDVWFPNWRGGEPLARIPELRSRAEEVGRSIPVMLMGVPADSSALEDCRRAGVARVVYWLPSSHRGPVERALESFEKALADLNGE